MLLAGSSILEIHSGRRITRKGILFRAGDFELAAAQYTTCLTIDNEGITENVDGSNAGGRLHAVLHCNRAACLMALKRLHEAIEECTYALKIHSRYMKAILRRARCYARLQQLQEGVAEYKRWLELVEEASKPNYAASVSSPCLFDGPNSHSAPQPKVAMSPRSEPSRDHYAILNVPPSANMEVIKRAFRKLAVKYHPDKNKEEGATENFLRIKLAHDTLSDPVKRVQYDSELRRMNRY